MVRVNTHTGKGHYGFEWMGVVGRSFLRLKKLSAFGELKSDGGTIVKTWHAISGKGKDFG